MDNRRISKLFVVSTGIIMITMAILLPIASSMAPSNTNYELSAVQSGVKTSSTPRPMLDLPQWEQRCSIGSAIATNDLWTPVILLNSPYGGSATGSSSTSLYGSFSITAGPVTYSTSTSSQLATKISASNGGAEGLFQLDQWTIYPATTIEVYTTDYQNLPCTEPYIAQITGTTGDYTTYQLLNNSSTADYNEATSFSAALQNTGVVYNSVNFQNNYQVYSGEIQNSGNVQSGPTMTVAQQTMSSFSVSVSISGDTAVGTGSVLEVGTSSFFGLITTYGTSYTYNFPAWANTYWDYSDLTGGSSPGLAFVYE